MTSRLPFEVLSIIASHLSIKDKVSCITVCKLWSAPFQDSLWSTINLNKRHLRNICNINHTEQNAYKKNGNRVQTLNLHQSTEVDDGQLYLLQQYFQRIKCLRIQHRSLSNHNFGKTANWNLWASLVSLEIHIPEQNQHTPKHELYQILACLPHLKHLTVPDKICYRVVCYTWRDLDTIHNYLPHLESLNLAFLFTSIANEDITLIRSTTPADKLKRVRLSNLDINIGWIFYCALKYPNIHTYESKTNFGSRSKLVVPCADTMSVIKASEHSFSSLRVATISQKLQLDPYFYAFWRTFAQMLESLQSLDYRVNLTCGEPPQPETIATKAIPLSSKTLQKLFIKIIPRGLIYSNFPLQLDYCPCLADLTLEVPKLVIKIDTILRNCVSLKKIKLKDGRILLSQEASYISEKHGLQRIEIWDSDVDPSILSYVSFCCPQLREMVLCVVKITDSVSSETTTLLLDMSFTQFDVLKLNNVVFRLQDNETLDSNDTHLRSNSNIHLLVIERTQSIFDSGEIGSVVGTPPVSLLQNMIPKQIWFQHCLKKVARRLYSEVRMLKKREVEFAKNYFQKLALKNKNIPDPEPPKNQCHNGFMDKNSWKDDLSRGYVLLRCKYVGKYEIETYSFDHDIDIL
ncbi:hypothetical protein J3Q64DRAFT_1697101 [Phycomyces blakesleeanus]